MISIRTWLVLAIALAACELEPPPKPAPSAPPTAVAPATPAPPPPAPAPVPRPATLAPVQPQNPACLAAAVHFTDVTIAAAKGPTRTQLEHDRTMIVKQTEDACIAQRWNEAAVQCFTHAGTAAELHVCDRQLAQPAGAHEAAGEVHHDPVIEGHVGSAGSGSGSGSSHSHRTRSHDHHTTHSTHGSR